MRRMSLAHQRDSRWASCNVKVGTKWWNFAFCHSKLFFTSLIQVDCYFLWSKVSSSSPGCPQMIFQLEFSICNHIKMCERVLSLLQTFKFNLFWCYGGCQSRVILALSWSEENILKNISIFNDEVSRISAIFIFLQTSWFLSTLHS